MSRGDRDAFAGLALMYSSLCWKTAYSLTLSRPAAEDAVQEAFARALRMIDRFDPERPFGPWIKRITTNCALDELRARRRLQSLTENALAELEAPEPEQQLGQVWRALAALTPDRRIPITLHFVLDYSYSEIATMLDCPIGTVASRVARGLEQLRRTLEATSAAHH